MDNINSFLDDARKSIGEFCMNECNAYCCRKGYLVLSEREVKLMIKDFSHPGLKKLEDGTYSFDLKTGCPQLSGSKCLVHKDPGRSPTCSKFPIFLRENKKVHFSSRCPAVKGNKFYGVIAELIQDGYKID